MSGKLRNLDIMYAFPMPPINSAKFISSGGCPVSLTIQDNNLLIQVDTSIKATFNSNDLNSLIELLDKIACQLLKEKQGGPTNARTSI